MSSKPTIIYHIWLVVWNIFIIPTDDVIFFWSFFLNHQPDIFFSSTNQTYIFQPPTRHIFFNHQPDIFFSTTRYFSGETFTSCKLFGVPGLARLLEPEGQAKQPSQGLRSSPVEFFGDQKLAQISRGLEASTIQLGISYYNIY